MSDYDSYALLIVVKQDEDWEEDEKATKASLVDLSTHSTQQLQLSFEG